MTRKSKKRNEASLRFSMTCCMLAVGLIMIVSTYCSTQARRRVVPELPLRRITPPIPEPGQPAAAPAAITRSMQIQPAGTPVPPGWILCKASTRIELWSSSYPLRPFQPSMIRYKVTHPPYDFHPAGGGDGDMDVDDIMRGIELWEVAAPCMDIAPPPDGNGVVDSDDVLELLAAFEGS